MARDIYEDQDEVEAPKDGLGNSLIYLTFLLLLGACFLMQKALGEHWNSGLFAKDTPPVEGS